MAATPRLWWRHVVPPCLGRLVRFGGAVGGEAARRPGLKLSCSHDPQRAPSRSRKQWMWRSLEAMRPGPSLERLSRSRTSLTGPKAPGRDLRDVAHDTL